MQLTGWKASIMSISSASCDQRLQLRELKASTMSTSRTSYGNGMALRGLRANIMSIRGPCCDHWTCAG